MDDQRIREIVRVEFEKIAASGTTAELIKEQLKLIEYRVLEMNGIDRLKWD